MVFDSRISIHVYSHLMWFSRINLIGRKLGTVHNFISHQYLMPRWPSAHYMRLLWSLILSRLDYCNSLFVCSSQMTLCRLQRVPDAATRLLCGASPRPDAPPLLKQLHWLLVSSRIFQTMHGDVRRPTRHRPRILHRTREHCDDSRLRSSERDNFAVRRTQLGVANNKTFLVSGSRAWNALLTDNKQSPLRASFRKKLGDLLL